MTEKVSCIGLTGYILALQSINLGKILLKKSTSGLSPHGFFNFSFISKKLPMRRYLMKTKLSGK